jgi:hypothetical protein
MLLTIRRNKGAVVLSAPTSTKYASAEILTPLIIKGISRTTTKMLKKYLNTLKLR